jgi:8-oxo-dGTP diphosphatase
MFRVLLLTCLMVLFRQMDAQENEKYKLPVFVAVIVQQEDQILLLKRQNTDWMDGSWGMPGGSLEPNETIAEAAARETYEEVGILINPEDLELVHVMHVRRGGNKDVLGFMFKAKTWKGLPENREPHKCSDVQWFNIHSLPSNVISQNLQAFELSTTGSFYSTPKS